MVRYRDDGHNEEERLKLYTDYEPKVSANQKTQMRGTQLESQRE